MCPIQSIICFNGGSGGDFLKAISNEQLVEFYNHHTIRNNGRVDVVNNNFKHTVEKIYYKKLYDDAIFDVDNEPVENTHYYIDQFKDITKNLFYIDYPDEVNHDIIKVYVVKRLNGNQEDFFDSFKSSLPTGLQHKLTNENLYKISEINWSKNIKAWRANTKLQKIALQDFFDPDAFRNIVKTLTGLDKLNEQRFLKTYNQWIDSNNYLKELFTK